ncbi:oxaloacetate decarboxylase subunit beta [Salmonella enterica subsp. enterica]|uniref:oxaloacetate decarboxylase (Na(+) extruding) n=1 Tax=Salmonella enterica I TaxID=59201 RepID=A0A379UMV9_SALET|nr:oxaloacetate decarboxylase subunit beta [Salmonella enterica subsp. enterica]
MIAAKLNCAPDVHAIKEALALALPSVQGQMENLAVDMGYTPGVLALFYKVAIGSGVAPLVIFMGVGAMTDFGPLLANPRTLLLGAAAQFGIFATVLGALTLNYFGLISFTLPQAAAIGIIGGADGPTAIYLSGKLAPELLGAIAVAAYSYMALVPLIQPPIMRALTSEKERKIRMVQLRTVSKREKILFPVVLLMLVALLLPDAAPLLGMFCFGNLMRESGVVERLSDTVQNGLINIVTIFLGLSVGTKLVADKFLQPQTLGILLLGVVAFGIGTAAGVLMAKLLNLCSKNKINPLIGFGGGVGGADGGPRIEQSGAGIGPAELPADARDGPERGGGYRFGHCRGRDAQVRAGDVNLFLSRRRRVASVRATGLHGSVARTDAQHRLPECPIRRL